MILRIQSGESLQSYIARNIFLNWRTPTAAFFKKFSKSVLRLSEIETIACAMGWSGCQGMNRLVHFHTDYSRDPVFKTADMLYFKDSQARNTVRIDILKASSSFCPKCFSDDVSRLGFSYWRRFHQGDIVVCAEHNVLLVRSCPFCKRPFTREDHGLDVIWRGCEGRNFSDVVPIINEVEFDLKRSKLLFEIYQAEYQVSEDAALIFLYEKLSSLLKDDHDHIAWLVKMIKPNMSRDDFKIDIDFSRPLRGWVFESILYAYGDFQSFIRDANFSLSEIRYTRALL